MLLADARLPVAGHTQSGELEPAVRGRAAPHDVPAYIALRLRDGHPGRGGDGRGRARTTCAPGCGSTPVDDGLGGAHRRARRCAPPPATLGSGLLRLARPPVPGRCRRCVGPGFRGRMVLGAAAPRPGSAPAALAGSSRTTTCRPSPRQRSSCCPLDPADATGWVLARPAGRRRRSLADGRRTSTRPGGHPRHRRTPDRGVGRGPRRHRPGGCSVPETTSTTADPAPRRLRPGRHREELADRSAVPRAGRRAASSASSPTTSTPTRTPASCAPPGCSTPTRIRAVETGACPHTAIRDDITANLLAVEELEERVRAAGPGAGRVRRRQPHRDLLAGAGRHADLRDRRRRRRRRRPQGRPGHRARRPARGQQDRPRAVRRRRRRRRWSPTPGGPRRPAGHRAVARTTRRRSTLLARLGALPARAATAPAPSCRPTRGRWRRTLMPTRDGTAMTITPTRTDVCSISLGRTAGGRMRVTSGAGPSG